MCLNGLGYFFEYIYFISENIFYNIEICVHAFKNPKLKIYIKQNIFFPWNIIYTQWIPIKFWTTGVIYPAILWCIQPRHGQWPLSDCFSKFWFGSDFKRSMTGLTSPKFFQRLISFQPKVLARARLIPDMPLVRKSPFSLSVKFNSN